MWFSFSFGQFRMKSVKNGVFSDLESVFEWE